MPLAGENSERPVISIAGPTGVGKTALALALAGYFPVEVVNADSRQIYRLMDIGTAKPSAAEQASVPHHLIDIVDPDQTLTMAEYQVQAYATIADIHARGKIALLVGGTGQYITAVLEGWQAPQVPPNMPMRAEFEAFAAQHGAEALFERLRELDPASAARMDPRNVRRTIRALEVCLETGQPFSAQRGKAPPPYQTLELALTVERAELYARLDDRVERMLADGWLGEVRDLSARGYGWHLPSMSGLGYAQLGTVLRGEASLEKAVTAIKHDTRTFVRRQYTWFRGHGAPSWLQAPQPLEVRHLIQTWLAGLHE